jgi:pimeloyl-ACP methyl ester carboxylesterase
MNQDVICIHGLWMPGHEMTLLRRRLRHIHGYRVRQYSYRSVTLGLDAAVEKLREFIDETISAGTNDAASGERDRTVQLVAHSLGGVLALHMLRRYPDAPVERVVCLGSPLVDSQPARKFLRIDAGKFVVGRTLIEGVIEQPLGEWGGKQEVGVIAGTRPFGSARFIMKIDEPNDGVVSVAETQLPGITDYVELPVTHAGLVLSRRVENQAAHFLRDGRFATG